MFQTNTSEAQHRLYQNARNLVFRTVKRAGIQKKVTPHLFRHSRITHLVNSGLQESVIKKMMWNNLDTQMFKTYVSLSEGDIDNALAEKAGISIKKKTQSLEPKECPFWWELNDLLTSSVHTAANPLLKKHALGQKRSGLCQKDT